MDTQQATDPVLGEEVIVELVRRHEPRAEAVTRVDESGGEARAYFIDGRAVLKVQRPHRVRPMTSLAREAFILEEIAAQSDLPVPRVLGYGQVDDVEYVLITRVPGKSLLEARLTASERARAIEELGYTLRRFHALDQSAFRRSSLIPGRSEPGGLRDEIAGELERVAATIETRGVWAPSVIEDIVARCVDLLPEGPMTPVVLHSNPGPEHTFVDGVSGFTGLIDFADACWDYPALDLFRWSCPQDTRALVRGYGALGAPSPEFDAVRRAGAALFELQQVAAEEAVPHEIRPVLEQLLGTKLPAV
jgi:aminoglycoside phosphotransferase (APT) family kinase protein